MTQDDLQGGSRWSPAHRVALAALSRSTSPSEGAHIIATARTEGARRTRRRHPRRRAATRHSCRSTCKRLCRHRPAGRGNLRALGKLDILVGNAGALGSLTPLGHLEPDGLDEAIAVNVTANWRLIRSLDPLLRQSDAGRAVFRHLGRCREARAPIGRPMPSRKAALEALVQYLCRRNRQHHLSAPISSAPAPCAPAMRAKAMPGEDPMTLPTPDEVSAQHGGHVPSRVHRHWWRLAN